MSSSETTVLTGQELRLKTYLRILFVVYLAAMFLYLVPPITSMPAFLKPYPFLNDPAFANNSVIKMALCAGLCFIAAADVRRFLVAAEVMIVVMSLSMISSLLFILFARNNYVMQVGSGLSIRMLLLISFVLDTAINVLLIVFYRSAEKARYQLSYFSPLQFRTLAALADVVIHGENEILKPREVANNVDRYMSSFKAKSKWITKIALIGLEIYPCFFLKPPTSYMRPDVRKDFLMRHFYQDVSLRLAPGFLRVLIQAGIRLGKQLCYMGYYNDPKVHSTVGYVPFSKRANKEDRFERFPLKPRKDLYVMTEHDINADVITADVVIIGSGPAASILAKGLIEKGRSVLLLERGEHTDPQQFNEDEIDMVSRLYADGSLQQARDFRFQVIQGSCVGGSSVVNNAVCFDTPDHVLDRWNDKDGLNAGLDLPRYKMCNAMVNTMIRVKRVPEMTIPDYLNPGGKKFVEGIEKLGLDKAPNVVSAVAANIEGCVGSGYCNIGCQFGKKLSMLDTILPDTQALHGTDALKIIAGCEAWQLKSNDGTVTSVVGKFTNDGRKIEVKGNTFVVAAGAISSSILLQRSGIAKGKAGKHVAFNVGSPISAVFPEPINSYDGLQISHYLQFKPDIGYIFETWFNPPMFQSTVMPGWWDDHYKNMLRYDRFACTGVLVGSEANAEIRIAGLTGREIRYKPTKMDFDRMIEGLIVAGEIYLAAGAQAVMPNTFSYYEYRNVDELKFLRNNAKDSEDLGLGTGHPQGGNAISATKARGVVDPEFKVYDYNNLYVCDASVFPGSVGVNPQITVMSLAEYAVPFIAGK
jgi:choline dehydrogenase-like flavoprotein